MDFGDQEDIKVPQGRLHCFKRQSISFFWEINKRDLMLHTRRVFIFVSIPSTWILCLLFSVAPLRQPVTSNTNADQSKNNPFTTFGQFISFFR
jgi:hypothetical protein